MDGKKWLNSKCSVKVEGIELADRLDMEKVRDERIKDDIIFVKSTEWMVVPFINAE